MYAAPVLEYLSTRYRQRRIVQAPSEWLGLWGTKFSKFEIGFLRDEKRNDSTLRCQYYI
eukprot:SAG31_NODE_178_length_21247_cov_11.492009_20_plen_59_part_00